MLKFSLATLMLVVTACCVWLALKSNAARRQREGIALVERLGGMITYDIQPEKVEGFGAWLMRGWLGDDYVAHVDSVAIWKGASDEHAVAVAQAFPRLSGLILSGDFSDAALATIGRLPILKSLFLGSHRISNEGLAELTAAGSIQTLRINGPISDAGMVHFKPLLNLTRLHCFADSRSAEVRSKLEVQSPLECDQVPLKDVLENLGQMSDVRLELDSAELKSRGIDPETPVTASYKMVSLVYVLEQILDPRGLAVQLTRSGALVTTQEKIARQHPRLEELKDALPNLRDVVTDW